MTEDNKSLTKFEILRKQTFYQKSFTGDTPAPTRSSSPLLQGRVMGQCNRQSKSNRSTTIPKKKTRALSLDSSTLKTSFNSPRQMLDYRRRNRAERSRPWTEKAPDVPKIKYGVQIFYDKTLPSQFDESKVKMSSRKYVSNSKYGNIYKIQQDKTKKREKATPPQKWLWEDEYMIWLNGTREKYLEDNSTRRKPVKIGLVGISDDMTSQSSRSSGLPTIQASKKGHRPTADVFASYHYHRLEKGKRKEAVLVLQRFFRGWYVRSFLKKLKKKALLQHGRLWPNFVQDYREVVTKIQTRYGIMKPSCRLDLREIKSFMDRKTAYEKAFILVAKAGKIHKDNLMQFFNRCDLWPTQGDISRAFETIFRGSQNASEVVFVLDCSKNGGVVGFHNMIKFVKDLVINLDIAPDRTRVGMVPYNEAVFNYFGISTYDNKQDILNEIGKIKIQHGLTRTHLALRLMREMFKNARPGVRKIGLVITGSQSVDPDATRLEARTARDYGIEIISVSIGEDSLKELKAISSSPGHVYTALDAKALINIKQQIEKRFCLASCGFCQRLLPRIRQYGLMKVEVMDIGWTIFPPIGAGIRPSNYLQKLTLDKTPVGQSEPSATKHVTLTLEKSEALDVVFTCYPPEACRLEHLHFSRWIRPVINNTEAWSFMDEDIIKATGMKACLRLVIQSRLNRYGYITVPSDVREGVEKVTTETQALEIIEKFIADRMTLKIDKDLKTVANLKIEDTA